MSNKDIVATPLDKKLDAELAWYMAWCIKCRKRVRCLRITVLIKGKKENVRYLCLHCLTSGCKTVSKKLQGIVKSIRTKEETRGRWL